MLGLTSPLLPAPILPARNSRADTDACPRPVSIPPSGPAPAGPGDPNPAAEEAAPEAAGLTHEPSASQPGRHGQRANTSLAPLPGQKLRESGCVRVILPIPSFVLRFPLCNFETLSGGAQAGAGRPGPWGQVGTGAPKLQRAQRMPPPSGSISRPQPALSPTSWKSRVLSRTRAAQAAMWLVPAPGRPRRPSFRWSSGSDDAPTAPPLSLTGAFSPRHAVLRNPRYRQGSTKGHRTQSGRRGGGRVGGAESGALQEEGPKGQGQARVAEAGTARRGASPMRSRCERGARPRTEGCALEG